MWRIFILLCYSWTNKKGFVMNYNELSIRFNLEDLNEFAPKYFKEVKDSKEPVEIKVEFVLNKNNIIEAVIQYYKNKYPNIDRSDNVFCTGQNLCGLEVIIGKSVNIDGIEVPIGFENETVESIFNEKFNDPKSTGIFSIKRLRNCGKPKEINMKNQTADMDEYGECCEKYYYTVDKIESLKQEIQLLQNQQPKNDIFGFKKRKNNEQFKKLFHEKEGLEQKKIELAVEKGRVFFSFGFDPRLILAYAYRLAAMKKIEMILKQFDFYKKDGTLEKFKFVPNIMLKPDNKRKLSSIIAISNNGEKRSYGG